jgi:ribonucleoside-diphosphate reductase alpha chain
VAMRVLDNVITLNLYPIQEAEQTSHKYRSVGLGFMGLAEYLACRKLSYDSPQARKDVDILFEKYALATLQASNALARQRGAYPLFKGSQWDKGILFGRGQEWYSKETQDPKAWQELIGNIHEYGLRFAYHLAPAPNTSTSGVVGTTAGLLPVYKKFFMETNAIAPIVTVAPNLSKENFWFYKEYAHMEMGDVIDMIAVVYKWIDQSVSFEWMINPSRTSPKQLFDYYMKAWEAGIKTVYYVRSMSGDVKEGCVSCSG